MFGIKQGDQFDYDEATARIHPDDRAATREAGDHGHLMCHQGYYRREFRVVWEDASVHWVASYGQVYFEGEGANRKAPASSA